MYLLRASSSTNHSIYLTHIPPHKPHKHKSQLATRISFVAISDIAEGFAFAYVGKCLVLSLRIHLHISHSLYPHTSHNHPNLTGIHYTLTGLSTWAYASDDVNAGFAVYMLCTVIAARFLTVTSICALCKHVMRIRSFDIPMHEQLTFSLGGVVRGSICWAQVLQLRGQQVAITTTLFIVIFTTVGCGTYGEYGTHKTRIYFPIREDLGKPTVIVSLCLTLRSHVHPPSHTIITHIFTPTTQVSCSLC